MRELVDERHLGPAGEDRVDVHLLEARAPVLDRPARDDLEVADLLGGLRAAVRLDEADDDVGAALGPAAPLVEHRERLADAGCGAEVDAERPAGHGRRVTYFDSVEREVQLEHVDAGLAEEAERAAVGVLGTRSSTSESARLRSLATRAAWSRALATEMCGSRPEPDDVTASTGTGAPRGEPVLLAVGDDPRADAFDEGGVRWAEVRAGARGPVVAVAGRRRAGVEVPRRR